MEDAKEAIKLLKKVAEEAVSQLEKLRVSTNLVEVCKIYKELSDALELIEAYTKILNSVYSDISEQILPKLFEGLDVDSIKAHNRQFILNNRTFFSIPQEKQSEGYKWLKEHGYGMLVKDSVNAQTLSAAMNEYVDEKGEYPPEEAMTKYSKKYISIRKK